MDVLSFDHFRRDPDQIRDLPMSYTTRRLLWKYPCTEIGQWSFDGEELDLLSLYLREGPVNEFKESCLIFGEDRFLSKGTHYFKEYSRSGPKHFMTTLEDFAELLQKIAAAAFEEDDLPLRLKTLLTIAEEILNHIAWGNYLAYQAGGVRKNFTAYVTPREIQSLQAALLAAARMYLSLLSQEQGDVSGFLEEVRSCFRRADTFRFMARLSDVGTKESDGTFFRLRWGGHELENAVHSWRIKAHFAGGELPLNAVAAQFYAGLTTAALAHAALLPLYPHLEYWVHVYAICEDHVKMGEWEKKTRREIEERLAQIPPLVRPNADVAGKSVLIPAYALEGGAALKGLGNYYSQLGAGPVYLSAVEAEKDRLDFSRVPVRYEGMEFTVPPTFLYTGPAPWRQFQKYVARSRQSK